MFLTSNGFPSCMIVVINEGALPEACLDGMIAGAEVIVGCVMAFLDLCSTLVVDDDAHFVNCSMSCVKAAWFDASPEPAEAEFTGCCSPMPCWMAAPIAG